GDHRRCHTGAYGAGARIHAHARTMELVGAQAPGQTARADRHQRVRRRSRAGPRTADGRACAMKRRRAPRGSGEQLRDEILDATTDLLLQTGHAKDVSIRSVARRVGVTPPSIYLHFTDKDALLDAVCARYFEKLDDQMQRAAAPSDGVEPSTIEVLRAQGLAYFRFALKTPE